MKHTCWRLVPASALPSGGGLIRDFAASTSTALCEACGVRSPVWNTLSDGGGSWFRLGVRTRVASFFAGDDFECGRECIRERVDGGGLFSITPSPQLILLNYNNSLHVINTRLSFPFHPASCPSLDPGFPNAALNLGGGPRDTIACVHEGVLANVPIKTSAAFWAIWLEPILYSPPIITTHHLI